MYELCIPKWRRRYAIATYADPDSYGHVVVLLGDQDVGFELIGSVYAR